MEKNGITKSELAKRLNLSRSEIDKCLLPNYNFTLRNLAKLEVIFDDNILIIN